MGVRGWSWVLAFLSLGVFIGAVYWAVTEETGFWVVIGVMALFPVWIVLLSLKRMWETILTAPSGPTTTRWEDMDRIEEEGGLVKGDAEVPGDPALHRAVPQETEDAP